MNNESVTVHRDETVCGYVFVYVYCLYATYQNILLVECHSDWYHPSAYTGESAMNSPPVHTHAMRWETFHRHRWLNVHWRWVCVNLCIEWEGNVRLVLLQKHISHQEISSKRHSTVQTKHLTGIVHLHKEKIYKNLKNECS